jgi:hypothetical protein
MYPNSGPEERRHLGNMGGSMGIDRQNYEENVMNGEQQWNFKLRYKVV